MKLRTRVVLQLAALCFVLAAYSFAADNAYLYIVHGIPGRDVAANSNPGFPVDVLIDGVCQTRGLAYGSTDGPLTFSPGTYDVQISAANTLAPCTNTPVIDAEITLTAGENVSAVAAISTGTPTLLRFSDNLSPVAAGKARFVLTDAAEGGELLATLTQLGVANPVSFTVTADPGKEGAITVPAGTYVVQVVLDGTTTVLASETIALPNLSTTFTYAAGEVANGSVGLFNKAVQEVF
jgi:hypothetical protein